MSAELLNAIGRLDAAAFQWLRAYHSPSIDTLMASLSDVTRGGALWVVLAVLIGILHPRRWPAVTQVLLAIGMSHLLADTVAKPFFNRARPFESYTETRVYGYRPTTRSLPSGHAANAIAAAYALTRLAPEGRAIFWVFAMLVAVSRVYLGVHYPGDVVVGCLLGLGGAAFVVGGTQWSYLESRK
ncbi:MAG TPA: phosphatase PAP2 family protein [Vicinamibacterales bacterium]|nr:phosphatase PAP2 family protein [Vicinamibacterales bacterium]